MRRHASQKAIQDNPRRINIRGRRNLVAAQLLGRRVRRGQRRLPFARWRRGLIIVERQKLGDSEVEQLCHAAGRDQNICWLEVAMDDEISVREMNGVAHLAEQVQTRRDT